MDEIEKVFNECYSECKISKNSEGDFEPIDGRMDLQDFRKAIKKLGDIGDVIEIVEIPKEQWGVHIRHCCKDHGCKYGNPKCPVETGQVKQEYPCESCDSSL